MIHKILRQIQGMAVCMAAIIVVCLPEAVICNGLPVWQGITVAAACAFFIFAQKNSPCLLIQDTSRQKIYSSK